MHTGFVQRGLPRSSPKNAAAAPLYKAIRQACIPPTAVISAPGLLVGSGMDKSLRGFLHAEPGVRDVMLAHRGSVEPNIEVQRWLDYA